MSLPVLILYADGGARGNPGPAGAGAYLTDGEGRCLGEIQKFLGETTNNVAEYSALILGLEAAQKHRPKKIRIFMDSQLVIRQLEGEYQVKQPHLKELHQRALTLLDAFPEVELKYIPREENHEADRLANEAMDGGLLP
ncbi:MAG: ribonuclease HI family protein [bacterium]|nr:ribonuclease HI family protein [bacterium]